MCQEEVGALERWMFLCVCIKAVGKLCFSTSETIIKCFGVDVRGKLDKLFDIQVFVFEMEAVGMRGWEEGVKGGLK